MPVVVVVVVAVNSQTNTIACEARPASIPEVATAFVIAFCMCVLSYPSELGNGLYEVEIRID